MQKEVLKVSSKSMPNAVAGAMAGLIREGKKVELEAIGAGAVNQAVKAATIARGFVAPAGYDLIIVPEFDETEIDGEKRTVMKLITETR